MSQTGTPEAAALLEISAELAEALEQTGFEICTFGPDEDPCDNCKKNHRQHYFGNTSVEDCREGDYFCAECVIELHRANQAALAKWDMEFLCPSGESLPCKTVQGGKDGR